MQHRSVIAFQPAKRFPEHRADHAEQWSGRHLVRHNFPIEKVQDRLQLPAVYVELGHVRHPLFIRATGLESTLQYVRGNMSELTFVGAIFLHSHAALQLQLNHQAPNRLVIHEIAAATDSGSDATITVPPLVALKQLANLRLQTRVSVASLQHLLLVIESAARETSKLQQARERILVPQFEHDQRSLFCACRPLAGTKASSFFR
jgi:hypothetical protein